MRNLLIVLVMGIFIGIFYIVVRDFYNSPITSPFASRKAKKFARLEKLSTNDFNKNRDYYRDIIINYSPSLLSYIDDFEISLPRDIIGALMLLEKKGYIIIDNGIFVSNSNILGLSALEKYILENITSGILKVNNDDIKRLIQEEGLEKNVIQKNSSFNSSKSTLNFKYLNILPPIILIILLFVIPIIETLLPISPIVAIIKIISIILFIISIYTSMRFIIFRRELRKERLKDPFFRTQSGEELNKQLEGLKCFLQDYSSLKSKNADMFNVWEDYLIYSIIFNQNLIASKKYSTYIDVN